MEVIKPEQEIEKPLFAIVIDIYESGNRTIQIRRETAKIDPSLSFLREVLHWASDKINDKLQDFVLKAQLNELMKTKIVKPGFRPLGFLDKIRGK